MIENCVISIPEDEFELNHKLKTELDKNEISYSLGINQISVKRKDRSVYQDSNGRWMRPSECYMKTFLTYTFEDENEAIEFKLTYV